MEGIKGSAETTHAPVPADGSARRKGALRRLAWSRLRRPEFWPSGLFYAPLLPYLAVQALRHGGLRTACCSNPGIDNGGLINESKDAILRLLPAHPAVLPWALHQPGTRPRGDAFPLVAKPDAGQRGSGVRVLRSQADLDAYAAAADFPFLTQAYCPFPHEAGVFYVRRPGEASGRVVSVTHKVFPEVVGDGRSTLEALILAHPRQRYMAAVFFRRFADALDRVPAAGERVRLSECGNHSQGTEFLRGGHLLGEGLERAIDAIASAMPGFWIGRFDLRYADPERFAQGLDFKILEVNGAAAEATELYDPSLRLTETYALLFRTWRWVFEVGAANRARGHRPPSYGELLAAVRAYRRSSRRHPVAS